MSFSETKICNIALSNIGHGKTISSLTEASEEARACNEFYDICLEATLRDFKGGFSKKNKVLQLVEEDPSSEWAYAYRYPNDSLEILRIVSGNRNETEDVKIPYEVFSDDQGSLIYTDQENAECEYIYNNTNTSSYPSDFVLALSFRLAAYLAPRLTGADRFKLRQENYQAYMIEIKKAHSNARNELQKDYAPDSELERSRI